MAKEADSADGLIRFVYEGKDNIYIEAHHDHDAAEMVELLDALDAMFGLELLDEDESEPIDLGEGWTRIYMACSYQEGVTWA